MANENTEVKTTKKIKIMATQKINIVEILERTPRGTVLYSPMVGKTNFNYLSGNEYSVEAIWTESRTGEYYFDKYGRYTEGGEMMLFPSNAMRDWSKFAWKKGDVLVDNEGTRECVFDGWYNDDYTQFRAKHWLNSKDENNIQYLPENQPLTSLFTKEDKESEECYINTIGERLGGKLNLETLEIEKVPKFKPFDRVLVRYKDTDKWTCNIFSHIDEDGDFICITGETWKQCVPFEGNEFLVGTNTPEDLPF